MKSYLPLVLLFLVQSLSVTAQKSLQSAFVVLDNGDTLRGWVNYKGWERNPRTVTFSRDSLSVHFTTYDISTLRYLEIASTEAYERATIKRTIPFPKPEADSNRKIDSLVEETVFLRLLVRGKRLSLYH